MSKAKMFHRFLALALCLVMALALLPAMTPTAWAADTTSEPTIDTGSWRIFANGTPIVIKDDDGVTRMYKSTDLNTPLFPDATIGWYVIYGGWENGDHTGDTSITIESGKLDWGVYGGSAAGSITGNTNITINGGVFNTGNNSVYGGGYSGDVYGNTNITINQMTGLFADVCGAGNTGSVDGNVSITFNDGSSKQIYCGGYWSGATVDGVIDIRLKKGSFNTVREITADGAATGASKIFVSIYPDARGIDSPSFIDVSIVSQNKTINYYDYYIIYNLDGGILPTGIWDGYKSGATFALPTPTKTDYTFDGWYSDSEMTAAATEIATTDTGNKEFWAKWITVPLAPNSFTATPGNSQVALSWSAPTSDGGSTITKYQVSNDNGANWTDVGLSTDHVFTGLTNGTSYICMVRAVNGVGNGAEASISAVPIAPGGGSGAPAPQTIPTNDSAVSVDFTQSGGTATLDMPATKVDEIINKAEDGTATLDLTGVSGATAAALPAAALTQLAEAGLDVEIRLPQGTVTLDADAAATAAKAGGSITISLGEVAHSALTPAQRDAIGATDTVFDITMKSGNTVISNFDGTITVTVPYTGELPAAVWYLNDAGKLEKLPCTYDAKTGTVTFTTDHLSLYVLGKDTAWNNPFTDVKATDWFYGDVEYVYNRGLMVGTSTTMFSPNIPLTRGMFATILWRENGELGVESGELRVENGELGFGDVLEGAYYYDAVMWAADKGIVEGYGDGKFCPENNVTREELVTMLYRYVQLKGGGFEGAWMFLVDYADRDDISDWAYEAVCWCTVNEIVHGRPGKLFDPQGTATRAEAAAMLHRFLGE